MGSSQACPAGSGQFKLEALQPAALGDRPKVTIAGFGRGRVRRQIEGAKA